MDNELVKSFSETILNDDLKAVSGELLEASLDSIFESEILQKVPIVGTLVAIGKTGLILKNRNLIRQTLQFMHELNNGTIENGKKADFSNRVQSGDKKAQEEIERIMLILDSTIDLEKSRILARLVIAYINETLTYAQFHKLTDILNRFYLSDKQMLLRIRTSVIEDSIGQEIYRVERLTGMGLIDATPKRVSFIGDVGRHDKYITISSIGKVFCDIGFSEETVQL